MRYQRTNINSPNRFLFRNHPQQPKPKTKRLSQLIMENFRKAAKIVRKMIVQPADGSQTMIFGEFGQRAKTPMLAKVGVLDLVKLDKNDIVDMSQTDRDKLKESQMRAFVRRDVTYPVLPSYGEVVMFPIQDIGNNLCSEMVNTLDSLTFNRALFADAPVSLAAPLYQMGDHRLSLETEVQLLPPHGAPVNHMLSTELAVVQNVAPIGEDVPQGRVVNTSWKRGISTYELTPLQDEYEAAASWNADKMHKVVATSMGVHRGITNDNFYSKFRNIQQLAMLGGNQQSFWTKLWLDFFEQGLKNCYTPDHWHEGQNANLPGVYGWSMMEPNPDNREPTDQFRNMMAGNGGMFFSLERGNRTSRYRNFCTRYAASWPRRPVEIRGHSGEMTGQVWIPRTQAINIPGHPVVYIHYGAEEALPGMPGHIVQTSQQEILAFAITYLNMTHSYADCMFGFQFASQFVFGKDSGCLGNDTQRNRRTGANRAAGLWMSYSQLEQTSSITLCKDDSRMEYLRIFCKNPEQVSPVLDLLQSRPEELMHIGMRFASTLGMSFDCAMAFANLTKGVIGSYAQRLGNTEHNHVAEMIRTSTNVRGNQLSTYIMNASAWMFGFSPILKVLETKNFSTDFGEYDTRGPGGYRMDHEVAVHYLPIALQEYIRAIPDYFMLPFEDGTVKWPEDLALPVQNVRGRIDFARLGNSLPFGRELGWEQDGGQSYNAQLYHSAVADQGPQQQFGLLRWLTPHQVDAPAPGVMMQVQPLPGMMGNFIRPGFVNTGALNVYSNYAHGVTTDTTLKAWGDLATKAVNVCTRIRPASMTTYVPESSRRYAYETPVAVGVPRARHDNIAILTANRPNVGVPQYFVTPTEAAISNPRRLLAGPASEANNVELGQGTLGNEKEAAAKGREGHNNGVIKKFQFMKQYKKGKKAQALEPVTPMEARDEILKNRTKQTKPTSFKQQMSWNAKRDEEKKNMIEDQERARKAWTRRQLEKVASEKARDDNFAPPTKGNQRHNKQVDVDEDLLSKLGYVDGTAGGGTEPVKPEKHIGMEDNKLAEVTAKAKEGLNAESQRAMREGKGSDDNIRKMGGLSETMELLTGGKVPVLQYRNDVPTKDSDRSAK
jgi:hypothetical protein